MAELDLDKVQVGTEVLIKEGCLLPLHYSVRDRTCRVTSIGEDDLTVYVAAEGRTRVIPWNALVSNWICPVCGQTDSGCDCLLD